MTLCTVHHAVRLTSYHRHWRAGFDEFIYYAPPHTAEALSDDARLTSVGRLSDTRRQTRARDSIIA